MTLLKSIEVLAESDQELGGRGPPGHPDRLADDPQHSLHIRHEFRGRRGRRRDKIVPRACEDLLRPRSGGRWNCPLIAAPTGRPGPESSNE